MNAPLLRFDARRKHKRIKLVFKASLRKTGIPKFDVEVLDVSISGFCCKTAYGLRNGDRVWLTLPGLDSAEATVAWRADFVYGCQFIKPLHPAVLDHVANRLGYRFGSD